MRDQRLPVLLLFLIGLGLGAVGCGSDDPTSPTPSEPSGPRLEIPGGGGENISIDPTDAPAVDTPLRVTPAFQLNGAPVEFPNTGELRLPVAASALDSLDAPEDLIGAVFAQGRWYGIPDSRFDTETGELVIPIDYVGPAELDSAEVDTTSLARRSGRGVFVLPGRSGGDLFAGLRPIYVSRVGGSDVAACGSTGQPCRTLGYALGKATQGEKVVLQGPGEFSHATSLLDLPPNARLEGRGGASVVDVQLRQGIPGSRSAVKNLTMEENGNGGNIFALIVTAGELIAENITSRSTRGITVRGGFMRMVGGSWRDSATFFDIHRGDRDHEFESVSIRSAQNTAVILQGSARAIFRQCTLRDNGTAVFIPYFGHATIEDSQIRGNGYGVVVGEFPSTLPDPVTATVTLRNNSFRSNTIAGVKLQTPAWQQCQVDGVGGATNEFDTDPPILWNGPAPWVGVPDVINLFAPLGPSRWWPIPSTGPSARAGAAMAWDDDLGRVILFGGLDTQGNPLDDTWSFDPASDTWQQESTLLPPSPRTEHAMASAPASQRLFLFGGRDNDPTPNVYDDLYLYDSAVSDWIPVSPTTTAQGRFPGARYGANFVYVGGDEFLLYGGVGPSGGTYAEWWIYDAAANEWSDPTNPVGIPPERFRGFAAGASNSGNAWFYGGTDINGVLSGVLGHYNVQNDTWTEGVFDNTGPVARAFASMQIVQTRLSNPQLLIFGGVSTTGNANASNFLDDTWLFGNLVGPVVGGPAASGPNDPRPPARGRHASVSFRRGRDTVCMIFGGADDIGSLRNDTWIWSPGGSN